MMLLDWRGLAVAVRMQVWLSLQMFGLLERKCPRPSWGGISFFGEKILVNLFLRGNRWGKGKGKGRGGGDDSSIDGTHLGIFPDSCADDMISFNSFSFPAQGYGNLGTTRFYFNDSCMTH